jgi:DDE superfamily endonuclease
MYDLLDLYAQPLNPNEPVVCVDEKSTQLLCNRRSSLPMRPGAPLRQDYEYVRAGTANLFMAVEPKAGRRKVSVTEHRGKSDFVEFTTHLLQRVHRRPAASTWCWTT